jgi:Fe-S-cluster containining protein
MKKTEDLFRTYESLVDRADGAFREIQGSHGSCVRCKPGCSDCCHAVFGLFLIEAGYLKFHFDQIPADQKKDALLRVNETERGLKRLESKMRAHGDDPSMQAYILATERVRCPLLDQENGCILYAHRPITCRVYGIPTRIHGKARVCGKGGFEKGTAYPTFDLDSTYRDLFALSKELISRSDDQEKASLLISVPKAITTPLDIIVREDLESR